ncbi:MAG: riboflavin biosynthesis protein RibF [Lachnospiraceae bacterium]|nr:riboflavin biosynthesis protein RibF [Candidatus Merdinaster equi]
MQIIENKVHFDFPGRSCVTLGKFDGLHIGHSKIIESMREHMQDDMHMVAFTFDPSPASFFAGRTIPELMTKEEKRKAFESYGFDYLWEFPMNDETAATKPYDFIKNYLFEDLKAGVIVAGEDVSFGDKGLGNAQLLAECADEFGYELYLLPKVCIDGNEVSSSYVRQEVSKGNMELVAGLLGKPYELSGIVEKGAQRGREFGFPTVNIYPSDSKLLPPYGVYYAKVYTDQGMFYSITDIGVKPTVTSEGRKVVESYLYNFDGTLYGTQIRVELLSYRRPEYKFSGVDELIKTLENDKKAGEKYFGLNLNFEG